MSCAREPRYTVQSHGRWEWVATIARTPGLRVRALPGMLVSLPNKTSALLDRIETFKRHLTAEMTLIHMQP